MGLIQITPDSHRIELELAYAGADNFTGAPVYGRAACYLHAEAEALLQSAVELARRIGLGIRIYDAFRPSEAQWVLWAHTPDPEFLADPRRGSPHSRGAAVDLTLIDGGGRPLPMGTGFDAFTPLSHHGNTDISAEAQRNRAILIGLMTTAGWDFYRNEWWHYQLFDARRLPLLSDSVLDQPMMAEAGP
ncbi:MAG: D-alanyl-D-alanine dipeptidase [Rhodospirillales bacterium]|jgi:D-alanyl-D-alanine dipeptidase|nr:D-alanyl-D-alanine dipeptidase [Rhodospirillaceae bacterium]MDP6429915.1 D-alanyl-D-alanine dipeptidase [Rhodospirillales bacterium]MDP6642627.1 D-alanyl-D-alanine dipeptidase [Rhodospirillales bacterium]MDP6840555.1 D-alanyl-D-alanine dipeptidase [Rhodospirillales bacterium]